MKLTSAQKHAITKRLEDLRQLRDTLTSRTVVAAAEMEELEGVLSADDTAEWAYP